MIAYLAAEGFENELIREVPDVEAVFGRLVLAGGACPAPAWAANIWHNPQRVEAMSISGAVRKLRSVQRNWAFYAPDLYRRHLLIQEQLPKVKIAPIEFLGALPPAQLGSWSLIERRTLLFSSRCSSPFPNGEVHMVENKIDPPSRAYLKLWEVFTAHGVRPQAGDRCLDLGSSPGGWTWVLAQLGCEVVSVDKAPLAGTIAALPQVRYIAESAFALEPREAGRIDWLFSDVICYPERLLKLVQRWMADGQAINFVCTIKLQGETDLPIIEQFRQIPGSQLIHLYHNKHELTWINLAANRRLPVRCAQAGNQECLGGVREVIALA
ncbi:MAG: SAM-dependent methyltransferase [Kiritimatiellae bacterium]|nr:SAM-dependent methyltransferase [Kiritimatiellia bacterium]